MENDHTKGVPATVTIAGHPIHPALIPFPIALLISAAVTDVLYWRTSAAAWAEMSWWLIVGGLATGALGALAGLIDFLTIDRAREHAAGWIHFIGNASVLVISAVNLWIRAGNRAQAIVPWGLLLSVIVAGMLAVTGWLGGELVFRHMIGVTGHERDRH